MNARLRDRRLTPKPRITQFQTGRCYWVERMTEGHTQSVIKDTFPEAVELALEWAGPKEAA